MAGKRTKKRITLGAITATVLLALCAAGGEGGGPLALSVTDPARFGERILPVTAGEAGSVDAGAAEGAAAGAVLILAAFGAALGLLARKRAGFTTGGRRKAGAALVTAALLSTVALTPAFAQADTSGEPEGTAPAEAGTAGGSGDEDRGPGGFRDLGPAAGWEESTADVKDTAATFEVILIVITGVLALGVLAAAWGVFRALKATQPKMNRVVFNCLVGCGLLVCVLVLTLGNSLIFRTYNHSLDALFSKSTRTNSGIETNTQDWQNLCYEISEGGLVLLRNEGGTLPVTPGRINLLGYRAYDPVYSGSGSGAISGNNGISIIQSLEAAGFEINPAPVNENVYEQKVQVSEGIGFMMGVTLTIDEVPLTKYAGTASFEAMKAWSDTAVVVIGRTGGEGADLTKSEVEAGKTYLQLSSDEEALLRKARETFTTLIVIYNSDNAMEMGYLETYHVDAAIWTGIPGPFGFYALGGIMSGAINPSGKLPDTYAYDHNSNPVHENYAELTAANTTGYYVDYVEGVYLGYKWYETAFAEKAVITNTKTGTRYDFSDYDAIVQYPFGYGLSYTTFSHDIVSAPSTIDPRGDIEIQVTVTNTGRAAGKDAVEIYLTAPYTDYDKQHGVEKAAVSLVGYGKTKDLAPGSSETITVRFAAENIASYDSTYNNGDGTKGAYMLDAGDYVFSARSDSHNVYDTATAKLASQYFYSGAAQRDSDNQAAYNQFDFASRGVYLSRQNGFANYREAMASVSPNVKDTSFDNNYAAYDSAYDSGLPNLVKGVDYDAPGSLKVTDMAGLSYDDPQWDDLIKQMSIDDMISLTSGFYGLGEVTSVGKLKVTDVDGPLGISNMFNSGQNSVSFPSLPVLAATFNNDLARKYGNLVADQGHSLGVTGWYAPAMNMHRSPFSGRNFEYYSEDPALSAGIAESETLGAREKGFVVYIKHFAFNDMESHRSGQLHTYMSEQAAREVYLRPFEYAVKYGGATGVMSAMNYIGDVYVSASPELITEVLRDEWGFNGTVLTDAAEGAYMTQSFARSVRAGTDSWLAMGNLPVRSDTNADIYYLRRLAKDILYTNANAQVIKAEMVNWRGYFYGIDGELILFCLLGACALFLKNRAPKTAA